MDQNISVIHLKQSISHSMRDAPFAQYVFYRVNRAGAIGNSGPTNHNTQEFSKIQIPTKLDSSLRPQRKKERKK